MNRSAGHRPASWQIFACHRAGSETRRSNGLVHGPKVHPMLDKVAAFHEPP